ncbi:MAG: hypothetical protein AAF849_19220 [Bacteroidota bacterium]
MKRKHYRPSREAIVHYLWVFLIIAGALAEVFLLQQYPLSVQEFDPSLFPFFIPPICTIFWVGSSNMLLQSFSIKKGLLLFLVLSIPLIPYFGSIFILNPLDDSGRYFFYAQQMIEQRTLWGGDAAFYEWVEHKSYATQPGYRYWNALYLLMLESPIRLIQFANVFLFIFVILHTIRALIRPENLSKKHVIIYTFLLMISFPAGLKNCLQNLSEWLTVVVLLLSALSYYRRQYLLFALLLALSCFFRQNLFFANTFIFFVVLLTLKIVTRRKAVLVLGYLFVVLLPLYHNLFYDHRFKFFVDIWNPHPYLKQGDAAFSFQQIDFPYLFKNFLYNLGLYYGQLDVFQILISLFIPLFLLWIINQWLLITTHQKIIVSIFIVLLFAPLSLFPTIAYYPRFQYVVYMELLLLALLYDIQHQQS